MRKLMLILSTFLLSSQGLQASGCGGCSNWPSAQGGCATGWPSPTTINVGAGYRQDKFTWNIAGQNNFPNIISELQWKDLKIAQVGGNATWVSCRNYAIKLEADYGQIYHGHVYDADYDSNSRQDLYSLSRNEAGKGYVYDLSAAAGYRVLSTCKRFTGTFLAGYSRHSQYLHLYEGRQLFPTAEPIPGLNSKYTTQWYGPWIGFDFEARVERCAFLFGGIEYHQFAYRGHGRWNLRPDIGRFQHNAYGMGYNGTLGGKWEIWSNWAIGVVGTYRNFHTRKGHENSIINTIVGPRRMRVQFNKAKWRSYTVSAIVSVRF